MIRGTTPTLTFELPMEVSDISEAWITMAQNGSTVLNKLLSDCTATGKNLSLNLSQQETLQLNDSLPTEIQLRVKLTGGNVLASKIIKTDTGRILKDGVM